MGHWKRCKTALFSATAIVILVSVGLACPLGMIADATTAQMMGQKMATQSAQTICHLSCGVPPHSIDLEWNGFVLTPFPLYLAPTPSSTIRPIFHPPTFA